jgi:hypothetical protein
MREGCWLVEMVRTNEQLPDDAQVIDGNCRHGRIVILVARS